MSQKLIINNPELQPKANRFLWLLATFLFWVGYVKLWMPLIALIGGAIGLTFLTNMVEFEYSTMLRNDITMYAGIISIMVVLLVTWAGIERVRFKNKLRRQDKGHLSDTLVAKKYAIAESDLKQLRQKQSTTVYFCDQGKISKISENNLSRVVL